MNFIVELEQEEDGRWLAEVLELPGVLAYGQTSDEAMAKAQALALRVLADRLEHGLSEELEARIDRALGVFPRLLRGVPERLQCELRRSHAPGNPEDARHVLRPRDDHGRALAGNARRQRAQNRGRG